MIIEVDAFKEKIPGYDPKKSDQFHKESGKLADMAFVNQLKTNKYKEVIFMGGGTASGKTEFAFSYLNKNDCLVYDGTLKNSKGFAVKLDKIKRYTKNKIIKRIIFIIPRDWKKSLQVFISRERKIPLHIFFETHSLSAFNAACILKETDIPVDIYLSSFDEVLKKLKYQQLSMTRKQKQEFLEFISKNIYLQGKYFDIDF